MNLDKLKRIVREEVSRSINEASSSPSATSTSETFRAQGDRLYVVGKPTRIDIETMLGDYEDVQVKKVVMNPDGTPTLTLRAGVVTKEIHYSDPAKVRSAIELIKNNKKFVDTGSAGTLTITPISA